MSQRTPGKTRTCPHCRATVLESANVCPGCRHHLRSGQSASESTFPSFTALKVDGTVRPPPAGEAWEYSMIVSIRNERGEEIDRQIIGVGALQGAETRTFTLSVEVFTPHQQW
ncbi:MAG: hypothetical protein M3R65_00190 [Gemmatimonadota bacterium]|nr:hypothetical protein [Gemmatimonadota bacterium]